MTSHAGATLFPPPPLDLTLAPVEHAFLVTRVPAQESEFHSVFTNTYPLWSPPPPGRSMFGGLLIGQAIQAAQQSALPGFLLYHISCSFRNSPDTSKPLFYRVEHCGDGRSIASREVKAEQGGTVFFSVLCSFSITGKGNPTLHQVKMPRIGEPPSSTQISARRQRALAEQIVLPGFLDFAGTTPTRMEIDVLEWHDYPPNNNAKSLASNNVVHSWVRCKGNMSASRSNHLAVLGSLTDSWFLTKIQDINPAAVGANGEKIGIVTSLNHTIWIHNPHVSLDEWLFVEKGSSWAADGRCLVEQRIWGADEKLVATCVQEGILKLKKSRAAKEKI